MFHVRVRHKRGPGGIARLFSPLYFHHFFATHNTAESTVHPNSNLVFYCFAFNGGMRLGIIHDGNFLPTDFLWLPMGPYRHHHLNPGITLLIGHSLNSFTRSADAISGRRWPLIAIALRFLEPITAPSPPLPAASNSKCMIHAYFTRFSP